MSNVKRIIVAIVAALLVPLCSDIASAEEPVLRNLRITEYADGVNTPCPVGTETQIVARAKVREDSLGTFALKGAVGEIVIRPDTQLNTEPVLSRNDRVATFVFSTDSRTAKVKKTGDENSVTVALSGPNMRVRVGALSKRCRTITPTTTNLVWDGLKARHADADPPCTKGSKSTFTFQIDPADTLVFEPGNSLEVAFKGGSDKLAEAWYRLPTTANPSGYVWATTVYARYDRVLRTNPTTGTQVYPVDIAGNPGDGVARLKFTLGNCVGENP